MTLPLSAQKLLIAFNSTNSWEQKMRLVMQVGTTLVPLTDVEKIEANQIKGCESPVWLIVTKQNNQWFFKAASEARIMRGLLATLIVRVNGLTTEDIRAVDLDGWFQQLGLAKQLSNSRRDGLRTIFYKIKTIK